MLIHRVIGKFNAVKWVSEDGYIFRVKRKHKSNTKSVYMICDNQECRGSCLILFQVNYEENPDVGEMFHKFSHTPGIVCRDLYYAEVQSLRKTILERAAKENTPNSVIFQEEISRAPVEVRNRINFKEIERSMQRSHQSHNPPTPSSLGEFAELIEQWSSRYGTINNEQFFIGKFGTGNNECLIALVTPIITSGLDVTADLHMDGTFKCRPKEPPMAQLYVLMASQYGRAFPIVWALMKSKAASAYDVLFEAVKMHVPGINPNIIMSDFETGLRESVKKHFPDAKHVGCWFHFSQAIERRAKKLGIQPGDHDGWKVAKRLMATALVPPTRAQEAVAVISEFAGNASSHVQASKKLIEYFKKQWIQKVTPASFSVYGQPRRTNNCQESLNRCLNRCIKPQGNTWDFWDSLRTLSIKETNYFTQLSQGNPSTRKNKNKWLLQDKGIRDFQSKLQRNEISLANFISAVSHRVSNNQTNDNVEEDEEEEEEEDNVETSEELVPLDTLEEMEHGTGPEATDHQPPYLNYRWAPTQIIQGVFMEIEDICQQQEDLLRTLDSSTPEETSEPAGDGETTCLICSSMRPTRLCSPCGRTVLCSECVGIFVRQEVFYTVTRADGEIAQTPFRLPLTCPACRAIIGQIVRVYY